MDRLLEILMLVGILMALVALGLSIVLLYQSVVHLHFT